MKYVLVIAVVLIAFHFWRNARREERNEANAAARGGASGRAPPAPEQMVSCARCGLHLPRTDAVVGANGAPYCGHEHRLAAGQ